MSTDDTDDGGDGGDGTDRRGEFSERLGEGADRAIEGFDQGLIDLLSWMLDTETRARIYVHLRQEPHSTSEEIAEGTGLYPSTVREALAELNEEGIVERRKRESEGAGNNPYEYAAIAPSELVGTVAEQVQRELNTVFNLDRYLDSEREEPDTEPVTITVEEDEEEEPDAGGSEAGIDLDTDESDDADDSSDGDDEAGDDVSGIDRD